MFQQRLRVGITLAATVMMGTLAAGAARADKTPAVDNVKGDLSVMVLGSSGPMAQPSGRASAGYLIFTDGKPRVLMDLGGGTFQRIAQSGANIGAVQDILLSHLHIDHASELPAVVKTIYFHSRFQNVYRTAPINIYGPDTNGYKIPNTDVNMFPSTSQLVNDFFGVPNGAFRYLHAFTKAGLGVLKVPAHDLSPTFNGATVNTIVSTSDGLVIKEIAVDHSEAPAVAYRIEYKGHSVVYSGDTHSTTDNMVKLAKNADLLIYDTSIMPNAPPPQSPFAKRHTVPSRIGQVATEANAKELVLSHFTPVTLPNITTIKQMIRSQGYTGKIDPAQDLEVYNVGYEDDQGQDQDHDEQ